MFRITANYDDRWHPLLLLAVAVASAKQQGDVRTVASVVEAMAAMIDVDWAEWHLDDVDGPEEFYGFGVTYTVERI